MVTKEPTETETGIRVHTCTVCGAEKTVTLPTIDHVHDYKEVVTAPTCTEQGFTTHTCSCGDSYVDTYVPAKGHSYGDWYTITEVDCTADGEEKRDCKSCDHSETRAVAATGHDYATSVAAPTCTEQGYTTHTCQNCGDTYTDTYVPALGHQYKDGICSGCGLAEQDGLLGDVNGDGEVDTTDAYLIVMYYNERIELDEAQLLAADVDGSGEVDTSDAYYIVMYYNERIDSFPHRSSKRIP